MTFDSLGRVTQIGDAKLGYNAFNMMETFDREGVRARYSYDERTGLRNGKVVNGKAVFFVLDEKDRVAQEKDPFGNVLSGIAYGEKGTETLTKDGKTYRYVSDILGNVVALEDAEGNIVNRYSYDVFGQL